MAEIIKDNVVKKFVTMQSSITRGNTFPEVFYPVQIPIVESVYAFEAAFGKTFRFGNLAEPAQWVTADYENGTIRNLSYPQNNNYPNGNIPFKGISFQKAFTRYIAPGGQYVTLNLFRDQVEDNMLTQGDYLNKNWFFGKYITAFSSSVWLPNISNNYIFNPTIWYQFQDKNKKNYFLAFKLFSNDEMFHVSTTIELYNNNQKKIGTLAPGNTAIQGLTRLSSGFQQQPITEFFAMPCIVDIDGTGENLSLSVIQYMYDWYRDKDNAYNRFNIPYCSFGIQMNNLYKFLDVSLPTGEDVDNNQFNGSGGSTNFGGNFDDSSDSIGELTIPSYSLLQTNSYHLYRNPDLDIFMNKLYTNLDVDEDIDAVNAIIQLAKAQKSQTFTSSAQQALQGIKILPVYNPNTTSIGVYKLGPYDIEGSGNEVKQQFVKIDCGSLYLNEYYGSFMDYYNTQMRLYLPFVGYVPIKPENIYGGYIKIIYIFDCLTGSFVAQVLTQTPKGNNTLTSIGFYSGSAYIDIPIGGTTIPTTSQNFATLIGGITTAAGGAASGGMGAVGAAAAIGKETLGYADNNTQTVVNGSVSPSSAMMGQRTPFVEIYRVKTATPSSYGSDYGYETQNTITLRNTSGLVKVSDVHLDGINCTQQEKNMIESLLADGVIL